MNTKSLCWLTAGCPGRGGTRRGGERTGQVLHPARLDAPSRSQGRQFLAVRLEGRRHIAAVRLPRHFP